LILGAIRRHILITPNVTLLDAGCGIGLLTRQFVASGFTVVGADFCAGAIDRAKVDCHEAEFVVSPLSTLHLSKTFDAVVVADVLLHVVDESEWRRALAALTDHVAVGGVLVILDWFEEDAAGLGEHVRPRAINRYEETLEAIGCEIVEHNRFSLDHEPGIKDLIVVRRLS
jgi:2-polyprenyl-3-methyl-5-hydroxy-6-metoxy-1,4-benzoquinol methylase